MGCVCSPGKFIKKWRQFSHLVPRRPATPTLLWNLCNSIPARRPFWETTITKTIFFSKLIIKSCEYIFSAQLFLFLINPSCEKTENVKRSRILQEFCIDFCWLMLKPSICPFRLSTLTRSRDFPLVWQRTIAKQDGGPALDHRFFTFHKTHNFTKNFFKDSPATLSASQPL